jgi:diguanylate cyclase (GGDEF)-like protein
MQRYDLHRGPIVALLLTVLVPLVVLAAQGGAGNPGDVAALGRGPASAAVPMSPRLLAAGGALITAATLATLWRYRRRAFIVYWIGGWLLFAGSLGLLARGFSDVPPSSSIISLAQLLAAWSTGLMLLAALAFPDDAVLWNIPLRVAAATAAWFLAAPFLFPLRIVMASGPAATAILSGWAGVRYLWLVAHTRYFGAAVIGAGMLLLCLSGVVAARTALMQFTSDQAFVSLLGFDMVMYMFIALGMHVLVFEDMNVELRRANRDLKQTHEEVKRLVSNDALTGCYNRRFFDEIERREFQRHRRYGAPLSVIFVDVNHFKQLNDTMGHDMGDEVLRTIGSLLRRHVRESDYVIRWGGDEFLLLLTCTLSEAERKATELKAAFELECRVAGVPPGIGLSIGVASASNEAQSLVEAVRLADTRMYEDKLGEQKR